jgi:hypothetical protein
VRGGMQPDWGGALGIPSGYKGGGLNERRISFSLPPLRFLFGAEAQPNFSSRDSSGGRGVGRSASLRLRLRYQRPLRPKRRPAYTKGPPPPKRHCGAAAPSFVEWLRSRAQGSVAEARPNTRTASWCRLAWRRTF